MRNILATIGAFFETHIEKIVLGIAGMLSLWLLMVFVVLSPNAVEYDRQKLSPGQIDDYIHNRKATQVKSLLEAAPSTGVNGIEIDILNGPIDGNNPMVAALGRDLPRGFTGLFACPVDHIDAVVKQPVPRYALATQPSDDRKYDLPYVGEVSDIQANHIRAAAYFPLEPVTRERSYEQVEHEPNDLDLVTVQAKFDVATLRARFQDSFASEGLPETWRDKSMAEPVFASVNLQRQERLEDGTWGPWQDVPRARIQPRDGVFNVTEAVQSLPPGGVSVLKLRLDDPFIRTDLLQPPAYSIASENEEWLPPEFYARYKEERRKEEAQERREEREAERDTDRETNRRRTGTGLAQGRGGLGGLGGNAATQRTRGNRGATRGGDRTGIGSRGGDTYGGGARTRGNRTRANAGGRQDAVYGPGAGVDARGGAVEESPITEIVNEYEEIRLTPVTDFTRMDEIVFWAHDDTVEPGNVYRYRIRVGVLNPVAGTDQVVAQDAELTDKAVLWSDFSDITNPMTIPERLYFFPTAYQEVGPSISVEVAKYRLGYWRSETFVVRPGESIGRKVEMEAEDDDETNPYAAGAGGPYGRAGMGLMQPEEPQTIDFSTDVVLVGASRIEGWTGSRNLRPQVYYEMLFSEDGIEIQHMPIGSSHWPSDLVMARSRVKRQEREPVEDFRSFGSSDLLRGQSIAGRRDTMMGGRGG